MLENVIQGQHKKLWDDLNDMSSETVDLSCDREYMFMIGVMSRKKIWIWYLNHGAQNL